MHPRRLLSLIICSALSGWTLAAEATTPASTRAGATKNDDGPEIGVAPSLETVESALAARRGRALIVHVWATWCESCVVEFPRFVRTAEALAARGAEVLLLDVDFKDGIAKHVRPFLRKHKARFATLVMDVEDPTVVMRAIDPAWKGAIPATFVYGADGKRRQSFFGETSDQQLRAAVEPLLAATPR